MPITRTTMIDDDGTGTTGTILNNAWLQTIYGQIDAATGVPWVTIPHNPANFATNNGSWVVSPTQTVVRYTRVGNTIKVIYTVHDAMTIAVASTYLYITIAGAPAAVAYAGASGSYWVNVGPAYGIGPAEIRPGTNVVALMRDGAGLPWPAFTGTGYISGEIFYNV